MYRFYINDNDSGYHFMELARIFLPDDSFEVIPVNVSGDLVLPGRDSYLINRHGDEDREAAKRELYELLSRETGERPAWGTLTGVRPLKLSYELLSETGSVESAESLMRARYLVSESKASLLSDILRYQLSLGLGAPSASAGAYIGIPFCPTRCEYCSFASNVADDTEIETYLGLLLREIEYTGRLIREHGTSIESVYFGGGTPTTLSASQLDKLLNVTMSELGADPSTAEFTVEAGRPDTIDADKLSVLRSLGIQRISINPQSMKDETLRAIGRAHTADDIRSAYRLASGCGFDIINADLIAGLPGEDLPDFEQSLDEVLGLGANNITVHTLSVKSGSRLRESDPEYYRRNAERVSAMVDSARDRLRSSGFVPYYIYRQKHQTGALENVGYCRPGTHSVYNIRIMEDKQTIFGLGAGAVGKVYYPDEDRIERIANVSDHRIYCERFSEMLSRKDGYYGG